jgi:hypothetical protein
MKFAAAVVVLLASAPLAAAAPAASKNAKTSKAPAKSAAPAAKPAPAPAPAPAPVRPPAPVVETPRLRHETIGIAPGYGSIEADSAALARKDDDTAIGRSLIAPRTTGPQAGPFAAIEAAVVKKKPQATGRIRVSFDVDRRGHVQRAIVVGFDRNLDRAIEAKLKTTVLPRDYLGQHIETVLAFQKGKLLRH